MISQKQAKEFARWIKATQPKSLGKILKTLPGNLNWSKPYKYLKFKNMIQVCTGLIPIPSCKTCGMERVTVTSTGRMGLFCSKACFYGNADRSEKLVEKNAARPKKEREIKEPAVVVRHRSELQKVIELISYKDKAQAVYQCAEHGKFEAAPMFMRRVKTQCPECRVEVNPLRLPEKDYLKRLKAQHSGNFELVGQYVNMRTPTKHRCVKHGKIFSSTPYSCLAKRSIRHCCPKCSSEQKAKPRVSEETFVAHLKAKNPNIEYVSGYEGKKKKATFHCIAHDHTWRAIPDNVINHNCPLCKNEIVLKHLGKRKDYVLGKRTVSVQGFEPQALDYLLDYFKPRDLQVQDEFKKGFPYQDGEKERWTYPDIYILSKDEYVEVKSEATLGLMDVERFQGSLRRTKQKARCLNKTIKYTLLVVPQHGKAVKLPPEWYMWPKAEIQAFLRARNFGSRKPRSVKKLR